MLTTSHRPPARGAAFDHAAPGPVAARPVRIEIRQRRTAAALAAVLGAAVVAAVVSGSGAVWVAAVVVAAVAAGYLGLVTRVRRLAAEREMSSAFDVDPDFDWDSFGRSLSAAALVAEDAGAEPVPGTTSVAMANRDLLRFGAAWALGVVLTPVVGAIRLARGDLSDWERP